MVQWKAVNWIYIEFNFYFVPCVCKLRKQKVASTRTYCNHKWEKGQRVLWYNATLLCNFFLLFLELDVMWVEIVLKPWWMDSPIVNHNMAHIMQAHTLKRKLLHANDLKAKKFMTTLLLCWTLSFTGCAMLKETRIHKIFLKIQAD